MRFDGKVAVVTGSGQGIGKAVALALAAEGAKVVTNNRKAGTQGGDAATVAAEIRAGGGEAVPAFGSVSDYKEAQKVIQTAVSSYGRIDILVNNAGILFRSPLINSTEEQIRAVIDVNIVGCIYCCQHAIPYMARQKYGKIVNMSSGAGLQGEAMLSVYSASKYAVLGLTEALAAELSYYNINVNAICPGIVRTAMNSRPGMIYTNNFFRREITVKDIVAGVLFLASDEARNVTSCWFPISAGVEKKLPAAEPYFTI